LGSDYSVRALGRERMDRAFFAGIRFLVGGAEDPSKLVCELFNAVGLLLT